MSTDERVAGILAEWRVRRDAGESVDPESVIAAHPDLAERLRAEFTALHLLDLALEETGAPPVAGDAPDPRLGTQIGPYRILRVLGVGGMARVYVAEQLEPVRRQVALKILARDVSNPRARARFDVERETLAMMDHPGIATIHDAGVTEDDLPFVVMELVDGTPITDHCLAEGLTLEQRLQLFARVCDAVQHANQRGIVHRDIKPSNVLVTVVDGRPVAKVIDFGLAKSLAGAVETPFRTIDGQVLGTPAYMSPEQALGKGTDVQTDVYALGVLLYELITGDLPWEREQEEPADFAKVLKRIVEEDPPKPSARLSTSNTSAGSVDPARTVRHSPRRLRGDLDWVTMRALEKNRARRYASAGDLGADVRRHLRQEPVEAGPPSTGYRVKKFVRRHRVGVVAGMAVLAALVAGLAVSQIHRKDAEEARALSEVRLHAAEDVLDYMVYELSEALEPMGRLDVLGDLADHASRYYESLAPTDVSPQFRRRRAAALGIVAEVLEARQQFDHALVLRDAHLEVLRSIDSADSARSAEDRIALLGARLQRLLLVHNHVSRYDREPSIDATGRLLTECRSAAAESPDDLLWAALLIDVMLHYATMRDDIGLFDEALTLLRPIASARPGDAEWAGRLAHGLIERNNSAYQSNGSPDHLGTTREVLRLRNVQLQTAPQDFSHLLSVADAQHCLACALSFSGFQREAVQEFDLAHRSFERLHIRSPLNHQVIHGWGWTLIQKARAQRQMGEIEVALATSRQMRELWTGFDRERERALLCIVTMLTAAGRTEEALREVPGLEQMSGRLGPSNRAEVFLRIGQAHAAADDLEEATLWYDRIIQIGESDAEERSLQSPGSAKMYTCLIQAHAGRARVFRARAEKEAEIAALRRAEALAAGFAGNGVARCRYLHAELQLELGRALVMGPDERAEAEQMLREGKSTIVEFRDEGRYAWCTASLIRAFDEALRSLR